MARIISESELARLLDANARQRRSVDERIPDIGGVNHEGLFIANFDRSRSVQSKSRTSRTAIFSIALA